MRALVLAAGNGSRLRPHTEAVPKPLLMLHGRPLIGHALERLRAAGADEITVVAGYRADQVRAAVEALRPRGVALRIVENERWDAGNARSLWCAREHVPPPFVLAMADHVVDPAIVRAVAAGDPGRHRLAVERAPRDDPRAREATLALVRQGRVLDLGKGAADWNALDTGVFWCARGVFDAITPELRDGEAGAVFAELARAGRLDAVDVTGKRWVDVDTLADLQAAASLFATTMTAGARGEVA